MAVLLMAVPMVIVGPAAQAEAVLDPADAIQRQFVPGHGVKIVERSQMFMLGSWSSVKPVRGVVGFGKGKIVATDMRDPNIGLRGTRNICIGKQGYEWYVKQDPDDPLPPGKTWVAYDWPPCQLDLKSGHVSLRDPATLKAVLATTKDTRAGGVYDGVRTTLYQGTITFAQLRKVNPDMSIGFRSKPTGKYAGWKVSWRLWIGGDQLVRRAWSTWREPNDARNRAPYEEPYVGFVEDLRLSDWGMKVHIKPPPAEETVPVEELLDD
ncbi:hypothetical protein ACTMTI_36710 [Nonomuraea sp. H19]|uniref:hypothetical protein n=1 Tax=Nonomuraea sp. H19 TaxID=3452206 RepID=UPI003F8C9671